jgi:hypothetical protein
MRDTFDMFDEGRRDRGRFGDNELRPVNQVEGATGNRRGGNVELMLTLHHTRPLALGVKDPARGTGAPLVWLPTSQIRYEIKSATSVLATIPLWLASAKGLI